MKDRYSKRVKKADKVILKDESGSHTCQVVDISKSGLSVISDHFFPTYKEIQLEILINEKPLLMKGSVRWSIDLNRQGVRSQQVGILIKDAPAEFIAYVEDVSV